MRSTHLVPLLLICGTAIAAPQPKPASKPAEVVSEDQLFAQLKKADSAEDAHPIEDRLKAMFRASGSPSVDLLMSRANAALSATDNKTALKLVQAVTQIAPAYAEGWHTRAGMELAAGDDTQALVSLQKVVLLNPRNFAALTELGDMLEEYGDKKGALALYRRAVAVDPQLEGAVRKIRELARSVEGQDI